MSIKLIDPAASTKMPTEFAYVLIGLGALAIQYIFTQYIFTMRARISVFRRGFMRQFDDIHAKAFPGKTKAPEFGYPDTGCGYYSKKLPYADWLKMNNGQRAQINFLEQITFQLVSCLIVSICYPERAW